MNDGQRRVLRDLIVHGGRSRVELARRLEVSRASLSRITRELIDFGFVAEGELQYSTTRGRPSELVHIRRDAAHFAGIKLTGTDLYAVVTDLGATVVAAHDEPLRSTEPSDVADQIAEVAHRMLADISLAGALGVCLAGDVLDRDGVQLVERSGFLGWSGSTPLRQLLGSRVGVPVTVSNDVVALTAAHHWFGAGVGAEALVVYGLGAGIGAGVVVQDEVYTGANGRSGHVGHSRMDARGRPCELGHVDCIHSFVTMGSICFNAGAEESDYPEVLARAQRGEPVAVRAFELAAEALGIVVATAVNTVDPEKVLITGEGVDMVDLAPARLRAGLAAELEQVDPSSVLIELPGFSFSDYARGAAVSAMRDVI
jgi:predicted NBD/HSP70 family sugar kinase